MANQEINKLPVNKQHFINVLKFNGTSIRQLGSVHEINRTEKTIRRYLDDGFMSTDLLNRIAKLIDVSPEHLSGYSVVRKDQLTKEEIEWLEVMRNLKNKTVRSLMEDLEMGGYYDNSAFSELHKLYTDDDE